MGSLAAMTTHKLGRDIVIVLSVKLAIVCWAALFVFGPHQRPAIDVSSLQHRILNDRTETISRRRGFLP